jgi:hypothetical protein
MQLTIAEKNDRFVAAQDAMHQLRSADFFDGEDRSYCANWQTRPFH